MTVPPHLETADAGLVGIKDHEMAGWCDRATGEVAPGFAVSAGDVVIDVGAGGGGFATFCGEQGAHVIVCDLDPARVETARASVARTIAREVEGIVGDGARVPLPDGTATRTICTEVLEHVDDPAALTAELARLTAPGGLVLITVPGARQERVLKNLAFYYYFEKPNHIRVIEKAELERLVTDAGLVIERQSRDGFFWSIYMTLIWQSGGFLGVKHPTLERWAKTWSRVIQGPDGPNIKKALDALLPKREVIVARKPG